MGLSKAKEKEYARVLFLSDQNLTQKEMAEKVGITEKTLIKWIDQEGWRDLKKSLLVTKTSQLSNLYNQMEWLNNLIATRKIVRNIPPSLFKPLKRELPGGIVEQYMPDFNPEDFPILEGNVATSKESDTLLKLAATINRLEEETGLGVTVEVCKQIIEFVRATTSVDEARKLTRIFDTYIQTLNRR